MFAIPKVAGVTGLSLPFAFLTTCNFRRFQDNLSAVVTPRTLAFSSNVPSFYYGLTLITSSCVFPHGISTDATVSGFTSCANDFVSPSHRLDACNTANVKPPVAFVFQGLSPMGWAYP